MNVLNFHHHPTAPTPPPPCSLCQMRFLSHQGLPTPQPLSFHIFPASSAPTALLFSPFFALNLMFFHIPLSSLHNLLHFHSPPSILYSFLLPKLKKKKEQVSPNLKRALDISPPPKYFTHKLLKELYFPSLLHLFPFSTVHPCHINFYTIYDAVEPRVATQVNGSTQN